MKEILVNISAVLIIIATVISMVRYFVQKKQGLNYNRRISIRINCAVLAIYIVSGVFYLISIRF